MPDDPHTVHNRMAVTVAMSQPAAAPLALFHLTLVSEVLHRQMGGRRAQHQQGQMPLHKEPFAGLGMPAVAALPRPVMMYEGLDKLHVLNALQSAYQTVSMQSQAAGLVAHVATNSSRQESSATTSSAHCAAAQAFQQG